MKQTPMLMRSPITDDRYVVTKYKVIDAEKGHYEAKEKFIFNRELYKYGLINNYDVLPSNNNNE